MKSTRGFWSQVGLTLGEGAFGVVSAGGSEPSMVGQLCVFFFWHMESTALVDELIGGKNSMIFVVIVGLYTILKILL